MSLAGIAIAIGVLVDAGIVVTENAFRQIEQRGIDPRDRRSVWEIVRDVDTDWSARPVFFSMAIILPRVRPGVRADGAGRQAVSSAGVHQDVRGACCDVHRRHARAGALHVAAAGPSSCRRRQPRHAVLCSWLYRPATRRRAGHRAITLGAAAIAVRGRAGAGARIGSEFMPPLNEGDLMFMPIADPSISLEENTSIAATQNAALLKFPEVPYGRRQGRARGHLHRSGAAEHDRDHRASQAEDQLAAGHDARSTACGDGPSRRSCRASRNIWTMPIIKRIDMLTTGIRSEVGVKIFGTDLSTLEALARQVADAVRSVPGASKVYPEQVTSGQYLNIRDRPRRGRAVRHRRRRRSRK